jgi:hypothetical protein
VPSDSADRSSSHPPVLAPSAPGEEAAAAMPAPPGPSAAESGSNLTTITPTRDSAGATDESSGVARSAPRKIGPHLYGYDAAGNPTLTDAAHHDSAGRSPPRLHPGLASSRQEQAILGGRGDFRYRI